MTLNRDRVNAQTAIRRAMLANGYTPLANAEKMCLLEGWPTLEVDEALIDEWSGSLRYQSTGLRIDGNLMAIDVDINDARIVEQLWDWACEAYGFDWELKVLIRTGKGAKECWVCRVDEPFGVPTGPKYSRPGEDTDHCIELYGSGQKRQIGAYGWHTVNEIEYSWQQSRGPAEVPFDELPVLTQAQAFAIYEKSKELMEAAGWERRATQFEPGASSVVYDLDPTLTVVTARGELSLEEAAGSRCRMLEVVGEGTNTSRGLVSMTDRGPIVWDSESYITHATPAARPEPIGEVTLSAASKLAEKLRARLPAAVEAAQVQARAEASRALAEPEESWEAMHRLVGQLAEVYALYAEGGEAERWVNMFTGAGYTDKALRMKLAPQAMVLDTETPQGKPTTKKFNPVDLLVAHRDRIEIDGYQFTPGNEAQLIEIDGKVYLNLWRAPSFFNVDPEPDVSWFLDYMEYLIPNEEERAFVVNWIARKVQHQEERGVGLVLVTPVFGTGRNVLMKLTQELLGPRWCGDVAQAVLTGGNSQSAYDDAFINKSLVTCDEIAVDGANYESRIKAYERLKSVVDPYPQTRGLNRKGLPVLNSKVYYSAMLASNHPYDALPLPAGDRRFAVIECTRLPFKTHRPDIKAIVDRVLPLGRPARASAIHGLYNALMEIETDADAFHTVPETLVRQTMIEDGEGDIEKTIRTFLSKLPADQPCFRFDDLARRGREWLMGDHPPAARAFERLARKKLREGFAGWTHAPDKVRVGHDGRSAALVRGIVERDDTVVSPADRARWINVEEG